MGCGTSSPVNEPSAKEGVDKTDQTKSDNVITKNQSKNKISPIVNSDNGQDVAATNPVPKAVAFDVNLEGQDKLTEGLLSRPPRRLQRLEPLTLPKLTPEMLAEKQKQADEKRLQQLKKKVSASNKSSRRHREIQKARMFEREQTSEQIQLKDDQLKTAEQKREAILMEIQSKQKIREVRAQRARERAKKLKDEDNELDIEVEKDEEYNKEDSDLFLDHNNENLINHSLESGYSSPQKKTRNGMKHPGSASTLDSFDSSFLRNPSKALQISNETDNFFDS